MAVFMAVSGEEVMTAEELSRLREDLLSQGADFLDCLRREVAKRRKLPNFRQLSVVCAYHILGPERGCDVGNFAVYVRPCVDIGQRKDSLLQAVDHGDLAKVVRFLEEPVDPVALDSDDREGRTTLHLAAIKGYAEIVRCFLEARANPKKRDSSGRTALHSAAVGGNQEVVSCLSEAGADICTLDKSGRTPLHLAADGGHQEVVYFLIEAGADKNKMDRAGQAPLHLASMKGHWGVVRRLVVAGDDKDKVDSLGRTPLHFAVLDDHRNLVRYLLDARADKDKANRAGRTPLHMAAMKGHLEIVGGLLVERRFGRGDIGSFWAHAFAFGRGWWAPRSGKLFVASRC